MNNDSSGNEFGDLLRVYRERCVDRRTEKFVTQTELARRLSIKRGVKFHRNQISRWETGSRVLFEDSRETLVCLIEVLVECGGIVTREQADQLVQASGLEALSDRELAHIKAEWKETAAPGNETPDAAVSDSRADRSVELYPGECGDQPFDLAEQRLLVTSAFGAYFAGLLERPNAYLDLASQVECPAPPRQAGLSPLQRILWLLGYPRGPRTIIVAADGGMGKSTLAAKIIRCLHQEHAVDLILGDSAKSEHVDPVTQDLIRYEAGYYTSETFFERVCRQLGMPGLSAKQAAGAIKDRLAGQRAIVVVDNLETVERGDRIMDGLRALTSRDVRAVVTTRQVIGLRTLSGDQFVVRLNPLTEPAVAKRFLDWHIEQYQHQHPALQEAGEDLTGQIPWLIERTGGIPLLMQLVLSDVARFSWNYVQMLPALFGKELLDFLYEQRWRDLEERGEAGHVAREFLKWIAREQFHRERISSGEIAEWSRQNQCEALVPVALSLLVERFLIINRDARQGNFSIYPSLAEFIAGRPS